MLAAVARSLSRSSAASASIQRIACLTRPIAHVNRGSPSRLNQLFGKTNMHNPLRLLLTSAATLLIAFSAPAQQSNISRFDLYTGFADIDSPELGLNQKGFHTQAGMNVRPWYSVGFDYSVANGDEVLTTGLLPTALQAQVNGAQQQFIALGLLPASYVLRVPTHAITQTFALGPQLTYRHFQRMTLFVRPSLGAIHERATPHPTDPFATVVAQQLAPAGFKADWTGFYGMGGGADFAITKHVGIRAQLDAVYNHPFDDILANGRWTFRYSVGPSFHFGRNITTARNKTP